MTSDEYSDVKRTLRIIEERIAAIERKLDVIILKNPGTPTPPIPYPPYSPTPYPSIPSPIMPQTPPPNPWWKPAGSCSVCGLAYSGIMGYSCNRINCPSGVVYCSDSNGEVK